MRLVISFICCIVMLVASPMSFAWGERGHDLITRVAVQHLATLSGDDARLMRPFALRDHMLAHLSNAPDIVWRAEYQSNDVIKTNSPTHYINLEKVITGVRRWDDLPRDFSAYEALCANHDKTPEEVGTAPWRSMQLYADLVNALRAVSSANDELEYEQRVNQALLFAGVLSHFVGDLANPHHTTANYDGQLSGQAGLHAYFESAVVADLDLKLASRIEKQARRSWLGAYGAQEREQIQADPQKLIWALVGNSHGELDTLLDLDKRYSLLSPSTEEAIAERKPVPEISRRYQRFAIKRLAVGADVLARLYLLAWQEAGQPDLSNFASYVYPVKPEFIWPNYQ